MTSDSPSPDVRFANVFLKDLKRLKKKYPKIRNDIDTYRSGGYRIIYQVVDVQNVVLLTIYSKSDQPDISPKVILQIITEDE